MPSNKTLTLIYQASRDGFSGYSFHSKVDGKINTLTIIKVGKNIFGGFTNQDWSGNGAYKNDSNAFLFSLVNSFNISIKMNVIKSEYAIYANNYYGPTFGSGHDFTLNGGSTDSISGYSNLGYSYQIPSGYINRNEFLAGSHSFSANEIETYAFDRNN